MSRLQSFLFRVVKPDGSTADAIFYAPNVTTARGYAEGWAERLGYRVTLVADQVVA